jgi:hypothetical protein
MQDNEVVHGGLLCHENRSEKNFHLLKKIGKKYCNNAMNYTYSQRESYASDSSFLLKILFKISVNI